jgi:hypothetical protein
MLTLEVQFYLKFVFALYPEAKLYFTGIMYRSLFLNILLIQLSLLMSV